MSVTEIANDYGLDERAIQSALDFYTAHRAEIDANITAKQALENERKGT